MSIDPVPRRTAAPLPVEPYYQSENPDTPLIRLRPLTALEQMYAYWGSDRV